MLSNRPVFAGTLILRKGGVAEGQGLGDGVASEQKEENEEAGAVGQIHGQCYYFAVHLLFDASASTKMPLSIRMDWSFFPVFAKVTVVWD